MKKVLRSAFEVASDSVLESGDFSLSGSQI